MSYVGKHRSRRREAGRTRGRLLGSAAVVLGIPTLMVAVVLSGGSAGSTGPSQRPASTLGVTGADGASGTEAAPEAGGQTPDTGDGLGATPTDALIDPADTGARDDGTGEDRDDDPAATGTARPTRQGVETTKPAAPRTTAVRTTRAPRTTKAPATENPPPPPDDEEPEPTPEDPEPTVSAEPTS